MYGSPASVIGLPSRCKNLSEGKSVRCASPASVILVLLIYKCSRAGIPLRFASPESPTEVLSRWSSFSDESSFDRLSYLRIWLPAAIVISSSLPSGGKHKQLLETLQAIPLHRVCRLFVLPILFIIRDCRVVFLWLIPFTLFNVDSLMLHSTFLDATAFPPKC